MMPKLTDYVGTLFDDASNPNKVTVALTLGVKALEASHSASIILMVDAVYLARVAAFDSIDIGEPFKPAKNLLSAFLSNGGNILVCSACMQHNGVDQEEIDERYEVINADDVLSLLMNAKGGLQLT